MDWLGIQITRTDLDRWLLEAREFALPRLLQTFGQIVAGAVLFILARWILRRIEQRFATKTASLIDDHIVRAVRRTLLVSIVAWVVWRTAHFWGLQLLGGFFEAAWIVALSIPIAELAANLLKVVEDSLVQRTETTLDDTALPLINKFIRFFIVAAAIVMALSHIGVDIGPFIAGGAVAGVAIGLAAKDTLSNLIAGLLLVIDRPFDVGDRIELWTTPTETATWGDVVEIGLRATKIRNPDNLIFVIPNNEIMRRDIVNYTASGDNIRLRIPISIAYDANADAAKAIIREVASQIEGVIDDPEPRVIIRRFGESSIDLQLRVWISNARQRRAISDEITERVKREFDLAGVEIPYAKRDLYIHTMPGMGLPVAPASEASEPENPQIPRGDSDE